MNQEEIKNQLEEWGIKHDKINGSVCGIVPRSNWLFVKKHIKEGLSMEELKAWHDEWKKEKVFGYGSLATLK